MDNPWALSWIACGVAAAAFAILAGFASSGATAAQRLASDMPVPFWWFGGLAALFMALFMGAFTVGALIAAYQFLTRAVGIIQ